MSQPGDRHERAAERAADAALNGQDARIESLAPSAAGLAVFPESLDAALNSPGMALRADLRDAFGARFGRDFAGVRIHANRVGAAAARELGARAFTVGEHIVFGVGTARELDQPRALRLLAHELAHVAQTAPYRSTNLAGLPVLRDAGTGSSSTSEAEDLQLRTSIESLMRLATPETADDVIKIVAMYKASGRMPMTFVFQNRDELFQLLAPWGFSGSFVTSRADPAVNARSFDRLSEEFDTAIAAWEAEGPEARRKRRLRTKPLGGRYSRLATAEESESRAEQIETEELPGGSVYEGRRADLQAERRFAEGRIVQEKIAGVVAGGAFSTLGRLVGGEAGAALGNIGDALLLFKAGRAAKGRVQPSTQSSGGSSGRPPAAFVEPAPTKNVAETQPDKPSKIGTADFLRTATPHELVEFVGGADRLRSISKQLHAAIPGEVAKEQRVVSLGVVREGPGHAPRLVYTVSANRLKDVEKVAATLGVTAWSVPDSALRATGRASRRTPEVPGAPGDAEQRLIQGAEQNGMEVIAAVPSKAACGDCRLALSAEGILLIDPGGE